MRSDCAAIMSPQALASHIERGDVTVTDEFSTGPFAHAAARSDELVRIFEPEVPLRVIGLNSSRGRTLRAARQCTFNTSTSIADEATTPVALAMI